MREEVARAVEWQRLSAQRWGGADATPGIVVPPDWRDELAGWPPDRWLAWRRRADELTPPGANADAIRAAQRRAFHELNQEGGTDGNS